MSLFSTYSKVEQLEKDNAALTELNMRLSERAFNMTDMLTKNRLASKTLLDERDAELDMIRKTLSTKTRMYERMRNERNTLRDKLKDAKEEHNTSKSDWNNLMDARDYEIAELKETLSVRDYEIVELKEALSERDAEITRLNTEVTYQTDSESMLAIKNNELQTQIDVLAEQHADAIREMENAHNSAIESMRAQLLASETKYKETRVQLERAAGMLSAISTASAYITNILSYMS